MISLSDITSSEDSHSEIRLPLLFEKFRWSQLDSINYKFEKWDGQKISFTDKEFEALYSNGYFPFAKCNDANFFDAMCLSLSNINGPIYHFDHDRVNLLNLKNKQQEYKSFQESLKKENHEMQNYFNRST